MKPQNSPPHKVSVSQTQLYSGPIPPPEALAKYETIQAGFADRLMKMGEKEQEERLAAQKNFIETEKQIGLFELSNFKRGQFFALLSVLSVVGLCALYVGDSKSARDIAVTVIIGLASVFIVGRFARKPSQSSQ